MSSTARSAVKIVVVLALVCLPLVAATLPNAKPEEVGFSSERLQRIHQMIQRRIDAGDISGAVTLVARNGRVAHFETHGLMDIETKKPMAKDAIFRLASMSKPITGVAVMMMIEEGKLRLTDPVSKFIPEFKELKVAVPKQPAAPGGRGGAVRLLPALSALHAVQPRGPHLPHLCRDPASTRTGWLVDRGDSGRSRLDSNYEVGGRMG